MSSRATASRTRASSWPNASTSAAFESSGPTWRASVGAFERMARSETAAITGMKTSEAIAAPESACTCRRPTRTILLAMCGGRALTAPEVSQASRSSASASAVA